MQAHKPTLAAALIALVLAIAGVITALNQPSPAPSPAANQHIVNRAQGNLKDRAVQAATAAANTAPTPNCNPQPGAGHLGACAPVEASAATGALAKAAGDPFNIRGQLGIDVSSYQPCGVTGPQFSVYKATEGTGYSDRCLRSNVAASKRAHKPYSTYDFLRPGRSTPEQEAAHYVATVKAANANTSLPPTADVEANAGLSPAGVLNYVCRWHSFVRRALHRSVSITYTGYWFWQPQVGAGSNCGSLLWVSAYASRAFTPHGFTHQTAWQYSDGIYGPTPHLNRWDSDVWLGRGRESLAALSHAKPPVPPPSKHAVALCRELNRLRVRRHHQHGLHKYGRRRSHAIGRTLAKHHYVCSASGARRK